MDKLLEVSGLKTLSRSVLLRTLFLIFFTENYLLGVYGHNLDWLGQIPLELAVLEYIFFIVALSVSWLWLFPVFRTLIIVSWVLIEYELSKHELFRYVLLYKE